MTPTLRLVAPFRPFSPENDLHRRLADAQFDWMAALRMLSRSCEVSCGTGVDIITDVDFVEAPLPALRYATRERRLMLWNLEVCLAYLASDDFDRDTVMLDTDQLVLGDLTPFFVYGADIGLVVRGTGKHVQGWQKLLNGVQFWSVRGKARLVALYRDALERARSMDDALVQWGADTAALCELVEPFEVGGLARRRPDGLTVQAIDHVRVIEALSDTLMRHIEAGRPWGRPQPVLDFRWTRKAQMRRVFESYFGPLPEEVA